MIDVVFSEVEKRVIKSIIPFGDVVCIGFALDIGSIDCDFDSKERKDLFARLYAVPPIYNAPDDMERFFICQNEDHQKLTDGAKSGNPIRIWKSAVSACGFTYTCDILRDIDCKISVVDLPEPYTDWGLMYPDQIRGFLPYERHVFDTEKVLYSDLWRSLRSENAPLRAFINGKLISVPEDFYDHIITKYIPETKFSFAELLGISLGNAPLVNALPWFTLRIRKMISENKLEIVGEGDEDNPHPGSVFLISHLLQ
jgi:hypothetical protein